MSVVEVEEDWGFAGYEELQYYFTEQQQRLAEYFAREFLLLKRLAIN